MALAVVTPADELRHPDVAIESWWWWACDVEATVALFVGLELRGQRFDYIAGLARAGERYLYVEELDGTGLRAGLELKPPEMWADHVCDVPLRQWSVGNEAFGVLVDDPFDVWRDVAGVRGELAPVAFDVEWYADVDPVAHSGLPGQSGYRQSGEVDARIELREGVIGFTGPSERVHVWGAAHRPPVGPAGRDRRSSALVLPLRDRAGVRVAQTVDAAGWHRMTIFD
jgi:hypothetical protein